MAENVDAEPDDAQLVERCRNGPRRDLRAFEMLVRRYEAVVYRVCLRILGNESDAEDVTQEVFLRVYRHLGNFEGRSSFKTWLMSIARNECLSFRSRRSTAVVASAQDPEAAVADDPATSDRNVVEAQFEARNLLEATLARLGAAEREVLVLRFVADNSIDDIAQALDLSLSAAKMRLYRAIDRFRATARSLSGDDRDPDP